MQLSINNQDLLFHEVPLIFSETIYSNVFSNKNNKTLRETIAHKRYIKFKHFIENRYQNYLNFGLGDFLFELKNNKDQFYREFLNKNGDYIYSTFIINDKTVISKKGLYIYCIDNNHKYIGRCRDSFGQRINQGYGKIHPKNCFIDG